MTLTCHDIVSILSIVSFYAAGVALGHGACLVHPCGHVRARARMLVIPAPAWAALAARAGWAQAGRRPVTESESPLRYRLAFRTPKLSYSRTVVRRARLSLGSLSALFRLSLGSLSALSSSAQHGGLMSLL